MSKYFPDLNDDEDIASVEPIKQAFDKVDKDISDISKNIENKVDKVPGKGLSTNDFTDQDVMAIENAEKRENKISSITYGRPYTDEYPNATAVQDYVSEQVDALYSACEHPSNKVSTSYYGDSDSTDSYYSVKGTHLCIDEAIKEKMSTVYRYTGSALNAGDTLIQTPSVGDVVNCATDMTIPGTTAFSSANKTARAVTSTEYTIWWETAPTDLQIYPGATLTVTGVNDTSKTVNCTVVNKFYNSSLNMFSMEVNKNLYAVFGSYAVNVTLSNLSNNSLKVKAGDNIAYTQFGWDNLHSSIDMSEYYTKSETNSQIAEALQPLQTEVKILSEKVFRESPTTWKDVQNIVRSGMAREYFSIGDQFVVEKTIDGVTEEIVFDIIGFDHDVPTDPNYTHSMTLQTHDGLSTPLRYDNPEATWYIDETTYPNGLAAGTYYFKLPDGFGTNYGGGGTYNFTIANTVPAGGQIRLDWNAYRQVSLCNIITYSSVGASAALETVSVADGQAGIVMPTFATSVQETTTETNSIQRVAYGSSRWTTSAIRQWLNTQKNGGSWWEAQTVFDRPPNFEEVDGFLKGVESEFLEVVGTTTKTTQRSAADDEGLDTATERFFLLSRPEVYGGNEKSTDGTVYEYYGTEYSDLSSPGTGNDTNRVKKRNGTASIWWLRTAHLGMACTPKSVDVPGNISGHYCTNSYGVAPACVIW